MLRVKAVWLMVRRSRDSIRPPQDHGKTKCNRLRIDPNDGSPVVDYRIEDDRLECRILTFGAQGTAAIEWELTPEQLTSHVLASTVVAYWLSRRFGVRCLTAPVMNTSHLQAMECKIIPTTPKEAVVLKLISWHTQVPERTDQDHLTSSA